MNDPTEDAARLASTDGGQHTHPAGAPTSAKDIGDAVDRALETERDPTVDREETDQNPSELYTLYSLEVQVADVDAVIDDGPCVICHQSRVRPRFQICNCPFSIAECQQCGLGMLRPVPAAAQLLQFYPPSYYGDEGSKFSPWIEPFVRLIGGRRSRFIAQLMPRGGKVLDVGCGRGILLKSLARAGYAAYGFEVSDSAWASVDPQVNVTVADSLTSAGYADTFFDAVVLWHVLEHIATPTETLAEVFRMLRPGGVVVVAVPNYSSLQAKWAGPAWFHLDPPRHLFHFPADGLKALLRNVGFQIESEHHFSLRQNPFGWIQSLQNQLRWLPRNGIYAMLHRRSSASRPLFSRGVRMQLWTCLLATLIPAVCVSILAAMLRRGATFHVVARKPV